MYVADTEWTWNKYGSDRGWVQEQAWDGNGTFFVESSLLSYLTPVPGVFPWGKATWSISANLSDYRWNTGPFHPTLNSLVLSILCVSMWITIHVAANSPC